MSKIVVEIENAAGVARVKITCNADGCEKGPCSQVVEGDVAVHIVELLLLILHKDKIVTEAMSAQKAMEN